MEAFSYILLLAVMSMLCLQVRLYSFGNGEECIFPEQLSWYSVPSFTSCLYAFVFVFVFKFVSVEVRVRKDSSSDREPSRPAVEDLLNCRGGRSGCKYQHIRPVLVGVS